MSIQRTTTLHLIMPCMCDTIELWLPQLLLEYLRGYSKVALELLQRSSYYFSVGTSAVTV